jgi:hypothetical protein
MVYRVYVDETGRGTVVAFGGDPLRAVWSSVPGDKARLKEQVKGFADVVVETRKRARLFATERMNPEVSNQNGE